MNLRGSEKSLKVGLKLCKFNSCMEYLNNEKEQNEKKTILKLDWQL